MSERVKLWRWTGGNMPPSEWRSGAQPREDNPDSRAEFAEFVPATEVDRLREALREAADDLDKAANQFESIRQSQLAGHSPRIEANPAIFTGKARRARAALGDTEHESDDSRWWDEREREAEKADRGDTEHEA